LTFEIVGSALLLGICAFLLKGFGFKGAPVFTAVAAVLLVSRAGDEFGYIFGSVKKIAEESGVGDALGAAIKVLGLGYLFGICADVCREIGEGGIAKSVEVVGRVEIIAVVIPYFEEIIKVGMGLIK
jgi:stage III sporulation protein AD